mgnify:CR=1 FL=1
MLAFHSPSLMTRDFQEVEEKESPKLYFPALDGLRFLAFFLVFTHHHHLFSALPYVTFLHTHGWIGVDLFFVLSVYLITKLLTKEFEKTAAIDLTKFFFRRILRIWPVYFLLTGLSMAIFFYLHRGFNEEIVFRFLGLITFSDNVFTAIYGFNPIPFVNHFWSISYEFQLYLLLPFIILFLSRLTPKERVAFISCSFLILLVARFFLGVFHFSSTAIWVMPITHFDPILLGILIGFGDLDSLVNKIPAGFSGFLGGLLFLILPCLGNNQFIPMYLLAGLSSSLVLIAVLNTGIWQYFFSHQVLVYLGKRSYGLYLFHLFGNGVAAFLIKNLSFLPSGSLASYCYSLSFTVIASILSYQIIERPFLIRKKKYEFIGTRPV